MVWLALDRVDEISQSPGQHRARKGETGSDAPGKRSEQKPTEQRVAEGMNEIGVGLKAMLFAWHVDSIAAAGLIIDDVWNERRVITIDLLGDEFLEAVKTGDPIKISEDGTVEVG